jgi:ketosteroid isomerase-like protein
LDAFNRGEIGDVLANLSEDCETGDRPVVAEVRAESIGRASETPVNQLFSIVYSMDEGKIMRMESFASEAEALEAVGPRE